MEEQNLDLELWAIAISSVMCGIILNAQLITLKGDKSSALLLPQSWRSILMTTSKEKRMNLCNTLARPSMTTDQLRMWTAAQEFRL